MSGPRRGERWPVIRTGPRDPIPPVIRSLVFRRDGGTCRFCGHPLTMREATLDHIIPWSAGGSDNAANLRILCWPCNERRSNRLYGGDDRPRLPVCRECVGCAHLDAGCDPFPVTPDLVPAFCGRCGLTSRTWPEMTL